MEAINGIRSDLAEVKKEQKEQGTKIMGLLLDKAKQEGCEEVEKRSRAIKVRRKSDKWVIAGVLSTLLGSAATAFSLLIIFQKGLG